MTQIKNLVGYHKPDVLLKNEVLEPIHMGRARSDMSTEQNLWMLQNMRGDDTGSNISNQNHEFCELTAIYWAWKNYEELDNPDYIGLMHYRRIFDFEANSGCHWRLDQEKVAKWYNEKYLNQKISSYDIVALEKTSIEKSIYSQYARDHYQNDLDITLETVKELYPNDYAFVLNHMNQKSAHFCNMFIMKKEIFFTYCEWLFSILFKVQKQLDLKDYSQYDRRIYGFLAERLTSAFIDQYEKINPTKVKELGVYFIENTEILTEFKPTFEKNNHVICFSADNTYTPYLGVALQSLLENTTVENNYDIFIIHDGINSVNQKKLNSLVESKKNTSLRFVDIRDYIEEHLNKLFVTEHRYYTHYSMATYYRLLIPEIFSKMDRVLYLDSDIVVLKDIADLYNSELDGNIIGAVKDLGMSVNPHECRKKKHKFDWNHYFTKVLELESPYDYFQAGVALMDCRRMREEQFTQKCFDILRKVGSFEFLDQCVLNYVCRNEVKYLDAKWNISWHPLIKIFDFNKRVPEENYIAYRNSLKEMGIIHYTTFIKPWQEPKYELADIFWHYARMTPFYEQIVYTNLGKNASEMAIDYSLVIVGYNHAKWRYNIYLFLSKIAIIGNWKRKFRKRKEFYKDQIRKAKQFMNNREKNARSNS